MASRQNALWDAPGDIRSLAGVAVDMAADLRHDVDDFLMGVPVDFAPYLEQRVTELYRAAAPVRGLLRTKGATVHLYRGEPTVKPTLSRVFLSWTPLWSLAAHFAEHRGYRVVEADVAVDDIVHVEITPSGGYVEFLVLDRPEYHVGRPLPWFGFVDRLFMATRNFTVARAKHVERQLRDEVEAVGGQVLNTKIDRENEAVTAAVMIPFGTSPDGHDVPIGDFVVSSLRPFSDVRARALW